MSDSSGSVSLKVSINYIKTVLAPFIAAGGTIYTLPWTWSVAGCGTAALAWGAYLTIDAPQYTAEGRPDPHYSKNNKLYNQMRSYLRITLHRTAEVQQQLVKKSATGVGQALFAAFPHGVNGDFRVFLDGMMPEAFPSVAPARTLAASVLFQLPGMRSHVLKTGCVDAGRTTAKKVLDKKLSLMVLPGGLDEQLLCEHGRERVFVKKRTGFVRLAIEHGVPLVPMYVFGCSDLYYTSRSASLLTAVLSKQPTLTWTQATRISIEAMLTFAMASFLISLRRWIASTIRIALPIYWGGWGLFAYPHPFGFPLPVPQNIVFGDPIEVERKEKPSKEDVEAVHARFIAALTSLFDAHKTRFGYGDRTLEVL